MLGLLDVDLTVYDKDNLDMQVANGAHIIFSTWGMPVYTEEEIRAIFPNLKVVFYGAGSVQAFARPFISCGIQVVSAWAANAIPVAEFALSQIILANKGFFLTQKTMREDGYIAARELTNKHFRGTFDCTLGIIGAGMIGRKLIELLKACNMRMRILVFDPFLPPEALKVLDGVKLCSLETLFEESQVISNHLADNPQTVGMLNYELFKRMASAAVFINTGRGAQVVEADLIRALNEQPMRTALLDVTAPEPPVDGHPFYTMPNVFLSSHISGSIGDETGRLGEYMLDELTLYLNGQNFKYEVTADMLERMA